MKIYKIGVGEVQDIHTKYREMRTENINLRAALLELYEAGCWTLPNMDEDEQAKYWENVRDVLRLPPGYATALGVNGL